MIGISIKHRLTHPGSPLPAHNSHFIALLLLCYHYYCFKIKMNFCLLSCKLLLLPYNIFTALGIQTASNNISNVCCYSSHITQRLCENVKRVVLFLCFSKIKRKTDKKMIMCDILTRTFHMTFMMVFYILNGWWLIVAATTKWVSCLCLEKMYFWWFFFYFKFRRHMGLENPLSDVSVTENAYVTFC